VPFHYGLWRAARKAGVAPWILDGYPADDPPLLWIIRCLEFSQIEESVTVERG